MRLRALPAALAALAVAVSLGAASFPAPRGTGGAVACGEEAATAAGLELLRAGGSAADAAVAAALALAVVQPEAGNLGGGGFAVARFGEEVTSLDFREVAPRAASPRMYLDDAGEPIPNASLVGPLATGVPGTPAGLWELHSRFGRRPWPEVVAPALRLAAGFRVSRRLHDSLTRYRDRLTAFPETAAVWLPDERVPRIGETVHLPALEATLRLYSERGPPAIMEGPIAAAIAGAAARYGGILTVEDLAAYHPVWRPPLRFDALGWHFASMDLPSSGGILLAQTLGLVERTPFAEAPRFGADRAHLLAEIWKRAYADRFLLGDPATTAATAADLLDPAWLDRRAAQIDPRLAASSSAIGSWSREPVLEHADTTHLSVVDAEGNLVSLTTTLNGAYGCRLLVAEAGFLLNNEMDDFATAPGRPNLFGLVQGEANAVAPGKRMLSSMAPSIAWRGPEALAIGGRGGSKIPTAVSQVLLSLLVDGDPLQTAVDRPRLHHQWLPDQLSVDPDALSPEAVAELERRGHHVQLTPLDVKVAIVRVLADGSMEAAGDPRGPGAAGVVVEE